MDSFAEDTRGCGGYAKEEYKTKLPPRTFASLRILRDTLIEYHQRNSSVPKG